MSIELIGLDNIPLVEPNDDVCQIIKDAIEKQGCLLKHGDIILIAETLISKAEGNVIKLGDIIPSEESIIIAKQSKKDSKLVEAIINESREVVAVGPDFIITETKQGFVCANSGIDESNVDEGLATPMPEDADRSAKQIREFLENEFDIGDMHIIAIKTSHDAPDSRGYIIISGDDSIVYITDTGYINKKYFDILSNRNVYVMESNHDIEMLNNGSYPFNLRQRILSDKGHLSNYDSAKYLSSFIGNNTKCIILAHLSEDNNTEELAYNTLIERLNDSDTHVDNIIIAKQNKETELVKL